MNAYVWSFVIAACVMTWPLAQRLATTHFERLMVSLAIVLISIVTAIGLCLLVYGRLRLVIILPLALASVTALIVVLRMCAPIPLVERVKPEYGRLVAMVALAVVIVGFGRQFQFASFWGDVGVYSMEAQHSLAGGPVTFGFNTSRLNIPPVAAESSVPNGMNMAPTGGRQFHALPTWPSVMALLGPSFDVAAILPLLYGLSIGLFYLLAREIFGDGLSTLLATVLLALLPLAWFLSLYATAEMLLLSITLATTYLYIKTDLNPIVLGLGMFAFGIVHISLFVISPIVGIIVFLAGVDSEASRRLRLALGSVSGAIAGLMALWFAMHVSQKYTVDITTGMFGSREYLAWVASVSSIVGGIPFVLGLLGPGPLAAIRHVYGYCRRHASLIGMIFVAAIVCTVAVQLYLMGWTSHFIPLNTSPYNSLSARVAYMNKGLISVAHHSMLSLMAAGGVLGLMAVFALPFIWLKEKGASVSEHIVWVLGAYVVILYGVLHVDVTNNYYASRYLLPVAVPTLLMLSVPLLMRWRAKAVYAVTLIGLVSLYYISALLGQGFFQGDRRFVKNIIKNLDISSSVYVEGSTWLDYMLVPVLADTAGMPNQRGLLTGPAVQGPAQLVTDTPNVVGGYKTCYSYDQRRIPWQISYPLHPQVEEHDVCVVLPSAVGGMNLRGNQWVVGGEFSFIAVGSANKRAVEIRFDSLGWWAGKKPFVSDWKAIKPTLLVCGNEFQLSQLTPKQVVFRGKMTAPFCHAALSTATFTPRSIGEGQDARSLGIDIYAVEISEI